MAALPLCLVSPLHLAKERSKLPTALHPGHLFCALMHWSHSTTLKFCSTARSTATCSAALWSWIRCLLLPASSPLGTSQTKAHGTESTARRALTSTHHPKERRGLHRGSSTALSVYFVSSSHQKKEINKETSPPTLPQIPSTRFLYKMQWKYLLVSLFWHFPPKADIFLFSLL